MRIALVSDTFSPLHTSGAVQMRDLAGSLSQAGHEVIVMVPGVDLATPWTLEEMEGFQVLRLRSHRTKDVSYVWRLWAEWRMPHTMYRNWKRSPLRNCSFAGVVFYSPSVFHTPLVRAIKREHRARAYLILRDIFPDWALDIGALQPGFVYNVIKTIARRQYTVADVIGVQSPGNLRIVKAHSLPPRARLEVLHNWLAPRRDTRCSIDLSESTLAGRRLCVYAGNIGVAQNLDVVVAVAEILRARSDIGFVLVGRGNDTARIAREIARRGLDNILMYDEIPADEIDGLYRQCEVGLVVLDPRHRTHNVPGKFVSYVHSGLPVLAIVNAGNDLVDIIGSSGTGEALDNRDPSYVAERLAELLERTSGDPAIRHRCQELARRLFSADRAAAQIVEGLAK